MQFFPVSFFVVALFLLAIRGGLHRGMFLAVTLLPFGMAAFANLTAMGNLSLPAAEVVAGITIGLVVLQRARRAPLSLVRGIDRDAALLLLLGAYALFSGIVLVRLFEARLYVFPLNASEEGLRVSWAFPSRLELLTAGATNVSQLCYLLFSIAFFFLCRAIARLRGTGYVHEAVVAAAWMNLALGTLDLGGLDGPLRYVRTAKYALLNSHEVQGFPRVVGGFPEASAYGGFSSVLAAYFAAHYLFGGSRRSALLAVLSALAAVVSFSSTAYLGLGVAGAGLVVGALWATLRRKVPARHLVFLHAVALGALTLTFAVMVTGLPATIVDVLDQLLFDKAGSSSALERGAWATVAMNAFRDSYFLGVGIGSLRGNGLVSVYLGSIGVPGAALLLGFYLRVLLHRGTGGDVTPAADADRAVANAARLAVVTKLATAAVAATTPDPGLMMMLLCAILATRPKPAARAAFHAASARPSRAVATGTAFPGAPATGGVAVARRLLPDIDLGSPTASGVAVDGRFPTTRTTKIQAPLTDGHTRLRRVAEQVI